MRGTKVKRLRFFLMRAYTPEQFKEMYKKGYSFKRLFRKFKKGITRSNQLRNIQYHA